MVKGGWSGPKLWKFTTFFFRLITSLSGNVKKKSIFKDIIQIKVDNPPTHLPYFDKLFFDKFLLGRASTLPTKFLTKK